MSEISVKEYLANLPDDAQELDERQHAMVDLEDRRVREPVSARAAGRALAEADRAAAGGKRQIAEIQLDGAFGLLEDAYGAGRIDHQQQGNRGEDLTSHEESSEFGA